MAAPRRLQKRRLINDLTVSQLSLQELQQELKRRIQGLLSERSKLVDRLESLDQELSELGVQASSSQSGPNGARRTSSTSRARRATNDRPLIEVLHTVVGGQGPMTTGEAAKAALATGYNTHSRTFPSAVSGALARDKRFTKQGGKWIIVTGSDTNQGD